MACTDKAFTDRCLEFMFDKVANSLPSHLKRSPSDFEIGLALSYIRKVTSQGMARPGKKIVSHILTIWVLLVFNIVVSLLELTKAKQIIRDINTAHAFRHFILNAMVNVCQMYRGQKKHFELSSLNSYVKSFENIIELALKENRNDIKPWLVSTGYYEIETEFFKKIVPFAKLVNSSVASISHLDYVGEDHFYPKSDQLTKYPVEFLFFTKGGLFIHRDIESFNFVTETERAIDAILDPVSPPSSPERQEVSDAVRGILEIAKANITSKSLPVSPAAVMGTLPPLVDHCTAVPSKQHLSPKEVEQPVSPVAMMGTLPPSVDSSTTEYIPNHVTTENKNSDTCVYYKATPLKQQHQKIATENRAALKSSKLSQILNRSIVTVNQVKDDDSPVASQNVTPDGFILQPPCIVQDKKPSPEKATECEQGKKSSPESQLEQELECSDDDSSNSDDDSESSKSTSESESSSSNTDTDSESDDSVSFSCPESPAPVTHNQPTLSAVVIPTEMEEETSAPNEKVVSPSKHAVDRIRVIPCRPAKPVNVVNSSKKASSDAMPNRGTEHAPDRNKIQCRPTAPINLVKSSVSPVSKEVLRQPPKCDAVPPLNHAPDRKPTLLQPTARANVVNSGKEASRQPPKCDAVRKRDTVPPLKHASDRKPTLLQPTARANVVNSGKEARDAVPKRDTAPDRKPTLLQRMAPAHVLNSGKKASRQPLKHDVPKRDTDSHDRKPTAPAYVVNSRQPSKRDASPNGDKHAPERKPCKTPVTKNCEVMLDTRLPPNLKSFKIPKKASSHDPPPAEPCCSKSNNSKSSESMSVNVFSRPEENWPLKFREGDFIDYLRGMPSHVKREETINKMLAMIKVQKELVCKISKNLQKEKKQTRKRKRAMTPPPNNDFVFKIPNAPPPKKVAKSTTAKDPKDRLGPVTSRSEKLEEAIKNSRTKTTSKRTKIYNIDTDFFATEYERDSDVPLIRESFLNNCNVLKRNSIRKQNAKRRKNDAIKTFLIKSDATLQTVIDKDKNGTETSKIVVMVPGLDDSDFE